MPFYEFYCEEHGLFESLRPISLCLEPAPCPICGKPCRRVYTAPNVSQMNPHTKDAMDRSVQSRYEPKVVNRAKKNKKHPTRKAYSGTRSWVVEASL